MRRISQFEDGLLDAATRLSVTTIQVKTLDDNCSTAVTLTEPKDTIELSLANGAERNEATKSLIGNIFGSFGKGDILRHVNKLLSAFDQARDVSSVAWHFVLGFTPVSIAQVSEK